MPILRKLKSLLGADDADEESERDVTVTVEHDPENEAAVKGAEVEDPEEAAGGTAEESDADEGTDDESASDESAEADADEPVEIPDAEGGTADADDEAEDAEADAAEADAVGADDSGSDEPVDVLNGIGPAYAERLENAGIETVGDLAAADAATLAEEADIAEGRIQGWIDQASEY
jgi:predicted flap endonuclease-1-like 5' DNA nuclease